MQIGRKTPGTKALRVGRHSEKNRPYLVTFITAGRVKWLQDLTLARIVCGVLNQTKYHSTLCYVVMPDHVHWLLVLKQDVCLSKVVGFTKSSSALQINSRLQRSGKFWQAGFHDRALRQEEDLLQVSRYVIANPLRAGLCQTVGEYPHWDAIWL